MGPWSDRIIVIEEKTPESSLAAVCLTPSPTPKSAITKERLWEDIVRR